MRDNIGLQVLALDWSDIQSKGAARREAMGPKKRRKESRVSTRQGGAAARTAGEAVKPEKGLHGLLTYRTLEIRSDSLLYAVDAWAEQSRAEQGSSSSPLPMLFVALHACGSLTPNLLRAFVSRIRDSGTRHWSPRAAVIVGCCYNLLEAGGQCQHAFPKRMSYGLSRLSYVPQAC